jgi:hypothetical protein
MTKDELRAFLAAAVPAAVASGRVYRLNRVGSGKAPSEVRGTPNAIAVPDFRPMRPRRLYQRQGVYGAGFEIETYKPFQKT